MLDLGVVAAMPRRLLAEALVAVWFAGAVSAAVIQQHALAAAGSGAEHSSEASAAAAGGGTIASGSRSIISPTLKPESDHAFRGDYVHDKSPRPKVDLKFGYPYPLVQDNGDYDKDFVKDENDDSGEWKAQMDYDTLRIKIEKLKAQVNAAKLKDSEAKGHLDAVTAKEAAAESLSEKAEKAADAAKQEHDEDMKDLQDLQGREGGKQVGGKIAKQVAEVNKEITSVEECQRQLEEAQAELRAIMERKQKHQQALEEAKHKAGADRDSAEAQSQAAKEAKYKKMDEEIAAKLRQEERDYQASVEEFRMDEAEMKKVEAEFSKAAAQLRRSRQKEDPQGGVYPKEEKSAAASSNPRLVVLAAIVGIAASCAVLVA